MVEEMEDVICDGVTEMEDVICDGTVSQIVKPDTQAGF
ncbi:hypothetical protein LTSEADE_2372 [Salmonella enterica subsp. enterica serovar Adelaide str. A4-669]|uniref:Uncharacterized protein n=1 Tax=Salmonella enterica subsp. enterica serovar Adelaide str. A4-669 TaxID=913063 RepID=A0A6C8GNR0_SALET|nr:hypothetical protein LTSEADE_2372 [Salmonella enterica subsp. enterica serovar Adelaide str. A4-669]